MHFVHIFTLFHDILLYYLCNITTKKLSYIESFPEDIYETANKKYLFLVTVQVYHIKLDKSETSLSPATSWIYKIKDHISMQPLITLLYF